MAIYKDFKTPETVVYDIEAINNAIKNILTTRRGTVPGNPTFGSNLDEALFNQIDHITESLIRKETVGAINEFEPRIVVNNIDIKSIAEYNKIVVNIAYEYRDKGVNYETSTNVVFNV